MGGVQRAATAFLKTSKRQPPISTLGGSLLSFGRAVLMFPITAIRAIGMAIWSLVADPVV
jgi:hypothetical protein